MSLLTYKVEYITNFDLGYQFFLPKDNNYKDKQNVEKFFQILDRRIKKSMDSKISFIEPKKKFYHCLRYYILENGVTAYFMSSGTVMIAINDKIIYKTEQKDTFAEEIFNKRCMSTIDILKVNSVTDIWSGVVKTLNDFKQLCYDTTEDFFAQAKVLDYRMRKMTFNGEARFGNHVGISYLHCIYNFVSYNNDETFGDNVSKLINYYEANSIESDGNSINIDTVKKFSNTFENKGVSKLGFEFNRQAWAKYNEYPYEDFKQRIIYYLDQWYNCYNLIYNIEHGIPVLEKIKGKNKLKYKEYQSLHLTIYENAINYMIDKLNNINAEIIPEINKKVDQGIVDSIRVVDYLKKTLITIKAKQNIIGCEYEKKAQRSIIIIKLSTLIFTALSAFKTTIDILNQTFKLSDGIILLGVIALFVTTLFIDSAGRKKW